MQEKLTKTQQKEVEKHVEKQVKKHIHKRLFEKSLMFGSEFKKQISTALIAAFGFIIALVWRDLISKLVQENIKLATLEQHPYLAALYTALIVTVIAIIAIALISRWAKKES